MPPLPNLIDDDDQPPSPTFLPAVAGNAFEISSKLKKKEAKAKKKHDAAMEQQNKEKAAKSINKAVVPVLPEASSPSPPPEPSPQPPPSEPDPQHISPILASLRHKKAQEYDTDAWADEIPLGASPPNKPPQIPAFVGSPPTAPVAAPVPVVAPEIYRGAFSRQSSSTSPRVAHRATSRPSMSGQNLGPYFPTSPRGRPSSMPSNYPEVSSAAYAQGTAYKARDPSVGFKSRSSSRRSTDKEFVAFDTIPPTGEDTSSIGDVALLAAHEESLQVFRVDRDGVHRHGRIEGLRGQVVSAKIIPETIRNDQLRRQRPLVAVIVHGPVAAPNLSDSQHSEFDASESVMQAMQAGPGQDVAPQYQTTVEVYSLKDRCHIATLYRSPILDMEFKTGDRYPEPPLPFGALNVQAQGRFVTVTSATSGEVFIYEAIRSNPHQAIKCIGKTWTSIQGKKSRSWSTSSNASSERDHINDAPSRAQALTDVALVSLSNRWLAVSPPVPGSRSTVHGSLDHGTGFRGAPGIKSHTSPSQPQVTCELDTPFEDSRLNKVARDVTQEVLKGARWVGDQGLQAWKSYWNKADESQPQDPAFVAAAQPQFPPTHADDSIKASQHPTLVSIIDLEKLSESQDSKPDLALQPAATFSLGDGCSFLSFSPSGLSLLTANTKGDVCYVWDLMRMVHGRSMNPSYDTQSTAKGFVRQVAKFTRVTIANIVDVVWAHPRGEKLAIVTDRGTVHIHDVPSSAFQWPPPARPKRPSPPPKRVSDVVPTAQASGIGAAFSAVSGGARPILEAVRGSGLPNWSGFNLSAASVGASVKGGRMVSTGLSKSMGAAGSTVESIRRIGESRLHLPGSARAHAIGSTRWIQIKDLTAIAVVGGNSIRMHSVLSNSDVKGKRRHSVVGLQLAEFAVPKTKDSSLKALGDGMILAGNWPSSPPGFRTPRAMAQPISHAELETSAPYQPFHTDRRVNLNVYDRADHHMDGSEPWVFGEEIPTTQIAAGSDESSDDAQLGPEAVAPMENLVDMGDLDEGPMEQPLVTTTTRKKKGKKKVPGTTGASRAPEEDDADFDHSVMIDFARERV